MLVPKKDGSLHRLPESKWKDAYPLPRVDDTLDTLAGSKWFSTLDMLSGYWQVKVSLEDREKTAFCTPEGRVMPFRLCNAPATFQLLMNVLSQMKSGTGCVSTLSVRPWLPRFSGWLTKYAESVMRMPIDRDLRV